MIRTERNTNILYLKLLILHFGLAYLVYMFRPLSTVLMLVVIVYFLFITIQNENRNNEALKAAAYIAGAEVFLG